MLLHSFFTEFLHLLVLHILNIIPFYHGYTYGEVMIKSSTPSYDNELVRDIIRYLVNPNKSSIKKGSFREISLQAVGFESHS